MHSFRVFCLCLLVIGVLAGCKSPPPPPEFVNATQNDQRLIAMNQWELRGRMAFQNADERFSANVRWQQQGNDLSFKLTNVVGVTLLDMSIKDGITYLNVDDKDFSGSDPEQLIADVSGWRIPITAMQRWVKGLALNTEIANRQSNGLLDSITWLSGQGQWQVTYQRYTQFQGIALPQQLLIEQNDTLSIRLKINEWTVQ